MKDYLKEWLGSVIKWKLEDSHNVSSELMKQCVSQDKTVFDERSLDSLDPRYRTELLALVKVAIDRKQIKGVTSDNTNFVVDLADGVRNSDAPKFREDQKKLSYKIDRTSDLSTSVRSLSAEDIRIDLARALGHVQVSVSKGSVTITDEFDFKGDRDRDSTASLLWRGIKQKWNYGVNTGLLTNIGRVFCKEENGRPTDSSIPVKITLNTEELGALRPAATSGNSSVNSTQRH